MIPLIRRRTGQAAALALAAIALVACSTVSTTASEVAIQYGGGPFDSVAFKQCEGPSVHEHNDAEDTHFYYPDGQRDWTFSNSPGADSPPLTSVTSDNQQITVTGTIKFTLNTDCTPWTDPTGKRWPGGHIQAFHELIDSHYNAAPTDSGVDIDTTGSWKALLDNYLGAAVDKADDNEALNFTWEQLYSDADSTAKWAQEVQKDIPQILDPLTLGAPLFRIDAVLLQKPGISPELQQGLADKAAAQLRQQSAKIDQNAATNFPGGLAGYLQYQQEQAINEAIKSGKVKVLPVPQGTSVIVNGN